MSLSRSCCHPRRGWAASSGGPRAARLALVLLLVACLALPPSARALSWPLCEEGGAVWVTERPSVEPTTPGSDLLFFCEQGLNIMGDPISPCTNNGTLCGDKITDAVCQLLGFDSVWMNDTAVAPAPASEPVKSLTGEWCVRQGNYTLEDPGDISSLPGSPCQQIEKISCIKSRESLVADINNINSEIDAWALAAPAPEAALVVMTSIAQAPATEVTIALAPMVEASAEGSGSSSSAGMPSPGGRRMKM